MASTLTTLEQNTGHEVAVVTVSSLEGDTIANFAVQLFADWKIGKAEADNGALLLVAPNEREVRIEVGYGLEPVLADATSYRIIQEQILPAFRDGRYFDGISSGVGAVAMVIGGEPLPEPSESFDWLWLIIIIVFILISVVAKWRGGSWGTGPGINSGGWSSGSRHSSGGFGGGSSGGGGASGRW